MTTPFPLRPVDVAALTVQEFTLGLDMERDPSLDMICTRFIDDANRALVWMIRYGALNRWRAETDMGMWRLSSAAGDACAVAASFTLNDRWEFDAAAFCAAVTGAIEQRQRTS